MKLVIDYRLAASSNRGMARYCREMTRELLKMLPTEWEVLLYIDRGSNQPIPEDVKVRVLSTSDYIVGEQICIPYYLKKDKPNVFWAPSNTFPLIRVSGIDYCATIHDLIFFEKVEGPQSLKQRIGRIYRRFVLNYGIKRLKWIMTVSEFSKNALEKRFHVNDVVVTPNCIGHFADKVKKLMTENNYSRNETFFTVSGDAPSKNFKMLYEWFKEHPKYKLEAAGFPQHSVYRNDCPLNITILPPNIPDELLIEKYRTCKAFLFVSKQEGFGIPLLEAMVCHCKIIATRCTSIPEIVEDLAMLIHPNSIKELNSSILSIESFHQDESLYVQRLMKYSDWKDSAKVLFNLIMNNHYDNN